LTKFRTTRALTIACLASALAASVSIAADVSVPKSSAPQAKDRPALPPKGASVQRPVEAVPGQYLIQLRRSRTYYDTKTIERSLKATVVEGIRKDMVLIQKETNDSMEQELERLRASPLVKLAEPNFIYHMVRTPNDTDYGKLWGLNNIGELDSDGTRGLRGVDVDTEKAWDITTGSKDVVVAIIDTGVDFKIPDLADNAWTNVAELNGKAGVDDDGNGYVDDIHGYNFSKGNGDPTDDNGHGSHVAGTIGAKGGDGRGIVGINWDVSIMAVKFLDAAGSGTLANAVKAIDYARKNGAKILSNSWGGGGFSQALKEAIELTRGADELFVAAAGNDGADNDTHQMYPANYQVDNIVSVAAVDNRGELGYFSNFGSKTVHLAAPGVNIYSTVPSGFETLSGTSMATPHVTGVAALVLSTNPRMSYSELKTRLLNSARPLNTLKNRTISGGIVDAYYALNGQAPPQDPNDPSAWANTQTYQVSTPHPYDAKFSQTYTIKVEGATRLAVRFPKFETEAGYDRVQFFNGKGESLGSWSGKQDGRYSPIADGDTLVVKFTADESIQGYGFDIDQVVFEK
jgi:subtilisin family serine protease